LSIFTVPLLPGGLEPLLLVFAFVDELVWVVAVWVWVDEPFDDEPCECVCPYAWP
jgi:hypothetical protein